MREQTGTAEQQIAACSAKGGKYLTFQLGEEVYGIEILRVQEIIGMMTITPVPTTPPEVRGLINLRGKVLAVLDLRLKFGMAAIEDTERTCITVVQVGTGASRVVVGIVVDNVCEVLDIEGSQIEPAPSFGAHVETDFILGIAKVGESVVTLLDIENVLSARDVMIVQNVSAQSSASA
ncbi:MAG TPA: chemotaxis protein CheW [Oligoflexia bacterium]|nr:chemotaxis protein CheW [Oligoflexia bacterium]